MFTLRRCLLREELPLEDIQKAQRASHRGVKSTTLKNAWIKRLGRVLIEK